MLGASRLERTVLQNEPVFLSGASASTSTIFGALAATALLSGASASTSTASGALATAALLSGTSASTSTSSGALGSIPKLSGASVSTSAIAGGLETQVVVIGRTVLVRDRPPLRLSMLIEPFDGPAARWANDEHAAANVPGSLTFSTTIPGGFEQASCTLARKVSGDYPDLGELSNATVYGMGGDIAWQGRLEDTPRTWGQQSSVTPQLVGYQADLADDDSAREIYVDVDRTQWQAASVQRHLNLATAGIDDDDPSSAPDVTTGFPSVLTGFAGSWARRHRCEAWYGGNGIEIGKLYYAWKNGTPVASGEGLDPTNTNWTWAAWLSVDDVASTIDTSGSLRAAGPGSGTLAASVAGRKFAALVLDFATAAGSSGVNYQIAWTCPAVYGNHGLTLYGTADFANAQGVLASDVIAHAVGKWAPKLTFTTGAAGTIRPTSFVIPHLVFYTPTTASEIIKAAAMFELPDWAVWDGPTFYCAPRGTFGRNWQARVGDVQLQETGPQVSRLFNGAIVTFTDVSGISQSVGPPGSGCTFEDSALLDSDPSNPATEAGIRRWAPPISMGTGTVAAATLLGETFLAQQKLLDTSGQATLVGHVKDDHGVWWPAWAVRAGDSITFVDAHDPVPRFIVKTSYSDQTKSCQIDLDSPAQGLSALLSRYGAALQALGQQAA